FFRIVTPLLSATVVGRHSLGCLQHKQKKTGRPACFLNQEKFLRLGGVFPPATPEWLSLNAPLSMARALRAIAFNP
ncbi:hypothetical protein MX050_18865, partial [Enterobacter hormaechei subsp. steigerwaltii]|uniref:hypothetical protein n=1 Tax=Enterobacter hormaechei TaxID=158836 RepID=UPI001FF22FC1